MSMQFVAAAQPAFAKQDSLLRLPDKPFVPPAADAGEALFDYVVAVKPDAPMQYVGVGGVMFQKYLLSPDASLVGNERAPLMPRVPTLKFTERQAKALWARVEESEYPVPRQRNPKFQSGNGEPEFILQHNIELKEQLILCKKEDYIKEEYERMMKRFEQQIQQPPAQQDAAADFAESLYKEQIKRGKKS